MLSHPPCCAIIEQGMGMGMAWCSLPGRVRDAQSHHPGMGLGSDPNIALFVVVCLATLWGLDPDVSVPHPVLPPKKNHVFGVCCSFFFA